MYLRYCLWSILIVGIYSCGETKSTILDSKRIWVDTLSPPSSNLVTIRRPTGQEYAGELDRPLPPCWFDQQRYAEDSQREALLCREEIGQTSRSCDLVSKFCFSLSLSLFKCFLFYFLFKCKSFVFCFSYHHSNPSLPSSHCPLPSLTPIYSCERVKPPMGVNNTVTVLFVIA